MPGHPFVLAETTWKTVRDIDYTVAVLPWGATEAHNLHLPYATDTIQCDHIAAEAACLAWEQGARVVVLPTVPFGVNTGQLDIKLDLNLMPSTQAALLRDLVQVLHRHEIKKLVVLNGHGGNDFRQMLREIQAEFSGMFLCVVNWYQIVPATDFFHEPGDHAGEMESSLMQHLAPNLVLPLTEAGSGAAKVFKLKAIREGWAWAERAWSQVTNDTGVGDPSKATSEKGQRFLEAVTSQLAAFIVELSECDLNDLYKDP